MADSLYNRTTVLMKKFAIFLFVALLWSGNRLYAQRATRVGFIDTDYILSKVASYAELKAELSTRIVLWRDEIQKRQTQIELKKTELLAQRDFLPISVIEEREREIAELNTALFQYELDRFGPEGDLIAAEMTVIRPIQDLIYAAVQEIAEAKNFDMIFDKSTDLVMLYFDAQFDISDLVIRKLAAESTIRVIGLESEAVSEEVVSANDEKREAIAEQIEQTQAAKEDAKKAAQTEIENEREERRKAYISKRDAVLKARAEREKQINEKRKDTIN